MFIPVVDLLDESKRFLDDGELHVTVRILQKETIVFQQVLR